MPRVQARSAQVVTELIRLGIVGALTAVGYGLGGSLETLQVTEPETARLLGSVLGALLGYLLGGWVGRGVVRSVDSAGVRLASVPALQLVASGLGMALGAFTGVALMIPALLLPFQQLTIPLTLLVLVALVYAGGRLGATRGADLGRFVGVRGLLEVSTPSRGGGVKIVDSSALIDGRIADVARANFLEGVLVVPAFVVAEVRRIAGSDEQHRRALGERGLATLASLQDEGLVTVELDDDPIAGIGEVDAKLAALCRARRAALVTTDRDLARTVELSRIRVLNPHVLADAVRSPVLPGDRIELHLVRSGREPGQGIGYLEDGTMVIVDGSSDHVGTEVQVEVTSIVQRTSGRLLFGALVSA